MASQHSAASAASPAARIAPILFAVLQVLTPLLPQLGVGAPIGDRSDGVRTLITPAGWAFSIWSLLYLGSFVFALYQALPAQRDNELLARLRWPAAGAFLGNALWAAYTQVFGLTAISVAIILFSLACLMAIYVTIARRGRPLHMPERWFAAIPLSALASWLTVASIVNIAACLLYYGVDLGAATPLVGAALLVVGGLIAALLLIGGHGSPAFALVFLWAMTAIYFAGGQRQGEIAIGAAVAALLAVVGASLGTRRSRVSAARR